MTFADKVFEFFSTLDKHPEVPEGVGVLNPYVHSGVMDVCRRFYDQYYHDNEERYMIIGINPGRLGAGLTGIPFTDPIRLREICGIENSFDPKPELSSKFIYHLIEAMGGPESFYQRFYFSSVSPLGFVSEGKNLNYYDLKTLENLWRPFMVQNLKHQLEMGVSSKVAFVLGRGKNFKYLNQLNKEHNLFDELIELPHPRWVMQYRLKRLPEFIDEFKAKLSRC